MNDTEKGHKLELRIQALESRFSLWRSVAICVIVFLGLGTAYGIWDLYQRVLDEAKHAVFVEAKDRIETLVAEAEIDAAAVKSAVKSACHDPTSVEKFGRCIFHLNPGRYGLDYGAATALCAAHGAELCTMDEVLAAQKKGAEWCSWGWVKELKNVGSNFNMRGSMAFPMQSVKPGCGDKAGLMTRGNIHVLEGNAGANCCI